MKRRAKDCPPYRPAEVRLSLVGRVTELARRGERAALRDSRRFDFLIHLPFHIADGRESHDRLADSCEFGCGDNFIDVLVGWPGFLCEARP